LVVWLLRCSVSFFVVSDKLWAATYIVRRTVIQIWQVSDSITILTNAHPIRILTWVVSTSWAEAANEPLPQVNIYGIIISHQLTMFFMNFVGPIWSQTTKESSMSFYTIDSYTMIATASALY
jgi:hypothetical protein